MFVKERGNAGAVLLALIYLAADLYFSSRGNLLFNLLPVALLLVYLAIARLDLVYFIVVSLTPLSVQFIEFFRSSPVDFALPTEPLLFGVMLIMLYKTAAHGLLSKRVFRHPVLLAVSLNLAWMIITSLTSTMPLVSVKFTMARIWFLVTYLLIAIQLFRNYRSARIFVIGYSLAMGIVVCYTLINHYNYGLSDTGVAHYVMAPFFRDHTSYGAVLAMLLFALGAVILAVPMNFFLKGFLVLVWAIFFTGLVFSYTRAAWVSVFFALLVLFLVKIKIRFRYFILGSAIALIFLVGKGAQVVSNMQRANTQQSNSVLAGRLQSISNLASDASNLERINRWNSALRMFYERPVFGWGPGTYMFKYAPFQLSKYKTPISTNRGDLGNAHSEYLGSLAESGIFGSLTFVFIATLGLLTGFRVYRKARTRQHRILSLGFVLALVTYLLHGAMNNFLDTDKVSALFWGFIAYFLSLDLYGEPPEDPVVSSEKLYPKY